MARRYRDNRVEPQAQATAGLLGASVDRQQSLSQALGIATEAGFAITSDRARVRGTRKGTESGLSGSPEMTKGLSRFTSEGAAFDSAARAAYVARTQVDVEDTYSRFETESPTNSAEYEAKSEGYRKGLLGSIADPDLKAEMDIVTRSRAGEGRRRVSNAEMSVTRDQQRTDILAGLDSAVQSAAKKVSQDGVLPETAMTILQDQIDTMMEGASGLFLPSQMAEIRQKAISTAERGIQSQQISNIAASIMGKYEADMIAGTKALKAVDSMNLDPEMKVEVQAEVRKRVGLMQEQRKQQYVTNVAALHKDLADGHVGEDFESEAFWLYRKGAISEEGYSSLVSQAERARVEEAKGEADLTAGLEAWKNGTPLDPKDSKTQKMMDSVFKQATSGVPRGTPEWQNVAIDMATRTNIVPSDAVAWSRTVIAAANSPNGMLDASQAATAADFLGRLDKSAPTAFLYSQDDKLKAFVGQVNDSIAAGAPTDSAVQEAIKNTYQRTDAEREVLRTQYSKITKGPQKAIVVNDAVLQNFLDSDDRYDQSFIGGAPTAPTALRADFNSGVERYYLQTDGNLEQARELAWRDVQRKWAYSTVNGKPELIPYAPEAMYPQIPVSMIRKDLEDSLTKVSTWDGFPAIQNADGSVSTRLTATVTTDALNGGKPTNIPTIWRGKILSEERAIEEAAKSGINFPSFTSIDTAVEAAKRLSDNSRPIVDQSQAKDLRLIQSPETAGTSGLNWNIGRVNEFGTVDVLLGPDKRPYRYQIPTDMEKIKALRDTEAKKLTDRAREISKRYRVLNESLTEKALAGDEDAALALLAIPKPAEGIK